MQILCSHQQSPKKMSLEEAPLHRLGMQLKFQWKGYQWTYLTQYVFERYRDEATLLKFKQQAEDKSSLQTKMLCSCSLCLYNLLPKRCIFETIKLILGSKRAIQ